MPEEILKDAEPIVTKQPMTVKAALVAGWMAGAVCLGVPTAVIETNKANAEKYADSVATAIVIEDSLANVYADSVNKAEAPKLCVVESKRATETVAAEAVYRPLHYFKKGDAVIMKVITEKDGAEIYSGRFEAGEPSLLDAGCKFVPSPEVNAPKRETVNEARIEGK
jgi:hypothetical protein